MVLDFGVLKEVMTSAVADIWDHKCLLSEHDPLAVWATSETLSQIDELGIVLLPSIPTVENLVTLAYNYMLTALWRRAPSLKLTRVRLYETPNCWADFRPGNQEEE